MEKIQSYELLFVKIIFNALKYCNVRCANFY